MRIGASTTGKEWAVKALHPSDPMTEVRGIPDQSCAPTTLLNFQCMSTVQPNVAATGTWSSDLTLVPDPVMPMSWSRVDSVGTMSGCVINAQLGSSYADALTKLLEGAQRWRLAYAGITVYQDGPALADQGTVVAAVVPVEPRVFSVCVGSDISGTNFRSGQSNDGIHFTAEDEADYETLIQMPNAYTGQSKFGVYLPLKLSSNHQTWHSERDCKNDATNWDTIFTATGPGQCYAAPQSAYASDFPYWTQENSWIEIGGEGGVQGIWHPHLRCMPCNENWGRIAFRNVSVSSRLTCVLRFGYEVQAQPGSPYSSYLRLSPPWDPLAIQEYFAISRELKDAYPADYNDLGKIWDVIKRVARTVLPVISGFGPVGAAIGGVGNGLLSVGEAIEGMKKPKATPIEVSEEERDRPPAAAVERAQALISAPVRRVVVTKAAIRKVAPSKRKLLMGRR